MTATEAAPHGLPAICEAARRARCRQCRAPRGLACEMDTGHGCGVHMARIAQAWRDGLLSVAEFWAVVRAAGGFASDHATLIYPDTGGQS